MRVPALAHPADPQHGQQVLEGEDHRVGAGDLEGDRGLESIHPLVDRRVARVEDAPAKNGVRAREFWVDDAVRVGVLPHDRDMDEAQDPVPEVSVDPDEEEHLEDVSRLELGLRAVVLEFGEVARDCTEEEQLESHDDRAIHQAVKGLLSTQDSLMTHDGKSARRRAAEGRGDHRLLEPRVVLDGVDVVEVDEQRQKDEEDRLQQRDEQRERALRQPAPLRVVPLLSRGLVVPALELRPLERAGLKVLDAPRDLQLGATPLPEHEEVRAPEDDGGGVEREERRVDRGAVLAGEEADGKDERAEERDGQQRAVGEVHEREVESDLLAVVRPQRCELSVRQPEVVPRQRALQPPVEVGVVHGVGGLKQLHAADPPRGGRVAALGAQPVVARVMRVAQLCAAVALRQTQQAVDDLDCLGGGGRLCLVVFEQREIALPLDSVLAHPLRLRLQRLVAEGEQQQQLLASLRVLLGSADKRELLRIHLHDGGVEASLVQLPEDAAEVVRVAQRHHLEQLRRRVGREDLEAVVRRGRLV
mmetsp:Transcript_12492/g.39788  ORF Transcript_12492/g.39788 Transcript_12492/m.39788 type:complete len:531 (-) Transcript_12492:3306-4898(-)